MTKNHSILLGGLLALTSSLFAATPPGKCDGQRDYQYDLRFIKEYSKFDLMAEYEAIDLAYSPNYHHYQLGGRYLISNGLKVGLHGRYLRGIRHETDWIPIGGGNWGWQHTHNSWEMELIPELEYKKWLFNSPLAASFRLRYIYNEHADFHSAKIRLGLLRFWEKFSLTAQVEGNFPLNYSKYTVDELWVYLGAILPLSKNFTLGHTIGFGQWNWSEPDNYPGSYRTGYKSVRMNLFTNFYF